MTNKDDRAKLAAILSTDNTARAGLIRDYWRDFGRAERTTKAVCYLHLGLLHGMLDNARERHLADLTELGAALDSVIAERDSADDRFKRAADILLQIRLELGAEPEADLVQFVKDVNARLAAIELRLAIEIPPAAKGPRR